MVIWVVDALRRGNLVGEYVFFASTFCSFFIGFCAGYLFGEVWVDRFFVGGKGIFSWVGRFARVAMYGWVVGSGLRCRGCEEGGD